MSWLKPNWNIISFWSAPAVYSPIMKNISPLFDRYKKTVGVSLIQQTLRKMSDYYRKNNKNIKNINAIDIGCGTGNYIKILNSLKGTILPINIIGVDSNESHLNLGKDKMKEFGHENITWENYDNYMDILKTLDDNSQHYILMNQHDWSYDEMHYNKLKDIINECYRILSDVGILYINHSNPKQIQALWYSQFIPTAINKVIDNYVETDWIINEMIESGFTDEGIVTQKIKEPHIESIYLMDFEGVMQPEWRAMDKIWNYVEDNELNECIQQIKRMSDEELHNLAKISRKSMMDAGSSTTIIGIKNFELYKDWVDNNQKQ